MRRVDGTSRNNKRDDLETFLLKTFADIVEEHVFLLCVYDLIIVFVERPYKPSTFHDRLTDPDAHAEEASNIFANKPMGVTLVNNAQSFRPEVAVVVGAEPLAGVAVGLAGEAPANKVN